MNGEERAALSIWLGRPELTMRDAAMLAAGELPGKKPEKPAYVPILRLLAEAVITGKLAAVTGPEQLLRSGWDASSSAQLATAKTSDIVGFLQNEGIPTGLFTSINESPRAVADVPEEKTKDAYLRVIYLLSDMCGLSGKGHVAGAVVVIEHADLNGVPAPSRNTIAEYLKEARRRAGLNQAKNRTGKPRR